MAHDGWSPYDEHGIVASASSRLRIRVAELARVPKSRKSCDFRYPKIKPGRRTRPSSDCSPLVTVLALLACRQAARIGDPTLPVFRCHLTEGQTMQRTHLRLVVSATWFLGLSTLIAEAGEQPNVHSEKAETAHVPLKYPGPSPAAATIAVNGTTINVSNQALSMSWDLTAQGLRGHWVRDEQLQQATPVGRRSISDRSGKRPAIHGVNVGTGKRAPRAGTPAGPASGASGGADSGTAGRGALALGGRTVAGDLASHGP